MRIGPYEILELIGKGGMGVVSRARHGASGREVAVKTVRISEPSLIQAIRAEIRALAQLQHPGVVKILDQGVQDGMPWCAMELLAGQTLRRYGRFALSPHTPRVDSEPSIDHSTYYETAPPMRDTGTAAFLTPAGMAAPRPADNTDPPHAPPESAAIPPATPASSGGDFPEPDHDSVAAVLTLVARVAQVLAYMHGEGVVHRDLKPDNIVVRPDGWPVIVDFGLTMSIPDEESGSWWREQLHGQISPMGTLAYMAPEQISGAAVDPRTDLYSLGCIVYELLAGQPVFGAAAGANLLYLKTNTDAPPLGEVAPWVQMELEALVMRLLARLPQDRVGHASDVATLLAKFGADDSPWAGCPTIRPYLYRPRLSGREAELSAIKSRLQSVVSGRGGAVLLAGEAGVGKTRLANEVALMARAEGAVVMLGACRSEDGGPLAVLRRPLRTIAEHCRKRRGRELDRVLGPHIPFLAPYEPALTQYPSPRDAAAAPEELPPEAARARLFEHLDAVLSALAMTAPPVLLLDDLQWIDELSLAYLTHCLEHKTPQQWGWLLVGAYRPEEAPAALLALGRSALVSVVALRPLATDAIAAIVKDMLAAPFPPLQLVSLVIKVARGIPFHAAEYLRAAVEQGVLRRDALGRWKLADSALQATTGTGQLAAFPITGSLRSLVEKRLESLSPAGREVLAALAVAGRKAPMSQLQVMSGLGDEAFLDGIAELSRRDIVENDRLGAVRVTQEALLDIAYGRLDPRRRTALHVAAATVIGAAVRELRVEHLAGLAYHWESAGAVGRARECYLGGARQACQCYAYQEAEVLFRSALHLCDATSESCLRVKLELADRALSPAGKLREAGELLEQVHEAARRVGLRQLAVDAQRRIAENLRRLGNSAGAIAACGEVIKEHRAGGVDSGLGEMFRTLGLVEVSNGNMALARKHFLRALEWSRKRGDQPSIGRNLAGLALVATFEGNTEEAKRLYSRALQTARALGNRGGEWMALQNMGIIAWVEGNNQSSWKYTEQALALAKQTGYREQEAYALGHLAVLAGENGDTEDARRRFAEALQMLKEIGNVRAQAIFTIGEVVLGRRLGSQRSELVARLAEAEATLRRLHDPLHLAWCLCERGHLALAGGASASSFLDEALRVAGPTGTTVETTSAPGRALRMLDRAQRALATGCEDELVCGEHLTTYPPALLRMLRGNRRATGVG